MGYTMKGSPAKLGTIQGTSGHASALKALESSPVKHNYGLGPGHPHPDDPVKPKQPEVETPGDVKEETGVETKGDVTEQEAEAKDTGTTDTGTTEQPEPKETKRTTGSSKYTEKVKGLRDKMKKLEAKGKTVKNSKRMRIWQNKINKLYESKVRHRKNILTGWKYKKKIKK